MSINDSESLSVQPSIDFEKVASRFTAGARITELPEGYIAIIAEGLVDADSRLRAAPREQPILYFNQIADRFVYGVGTTNGEGIRLTQDAATGKDQIAFGNNAVIQETVIGDEYDHTMTRGGPLVISEGFPLDPFIDFSISGYMAVGKDEIIDRIRLGGSSQNARIAFMLEKAGISTDTFFQDYFYPGDSEPEGGHDKARAEVIKELTRLVEYIKKTRFM